MKLRYYLRGIGIGIIVAAAICICASLRSGKMTDEQVKKRAAELGMTESGNLLTDVAKASEEAVSEEAVSQVIPEITSIEATEEDQSVSQTEEAVSTVEEEASSAEEASKEAEEASKASEEASKAAEEAEAAKAAEEAAKEAEAAKKAEETKEAEAAKEEAPKNDSKDTVTFVIDKGNGSDTVARKLASAGLVKDAAAYDKWLIANGYDRRLAAGSHQIPKGASEEEIAKILTGAR